MRAPENGFRIFEEGAYLAAFFYLLVTLIIKKTHMKQVMKMLSMVALCVMTGLFSCKDDDPETCESGAFAMTINNETVTDVSFDNTLLKGNSAGVNGKRMDIRATDDSGRDLIITFTDLSTGTTGNGISTDAYIPFDDITTGTENTFFFTIIDGTDTYTFFDGNLDITSCDASAKKVSGTFSFFDVDFEVTNGSFTDVCYTIIK